jgi:protein-glutamine gamma-glutamyltransferase
VKLEFRRPSGPSEDSVAMRVVVASAVEIAIAAVVVQPGAVEPFIATAALVLAPVGYWWSYRCRRQPNVLLKVLLAVALLVALGQFLGQVRAVPTVDQARIPLATLFLWVQVLHAFDVPRRRDLAFSVVSSLILMAEAGSLSLTTGYALFLVPWAGFAGAWLRLSARPRPDRLTTPVSVRRVASIRPRRRVSRAIRSGAFTATAVLCAGFLVFLAMPRVTGTLLKTPPFSLRRASPVNGFEGEVQNPGLTSQAADGVADFAPDAYPGFGDVVDLRSRGRLSDEVAFRVRSSQAALWRAETFDTYDGTRWTITDDRTEPVGRDPDGLAYDPRWSAGQRGATVSQVMQTFYIDTPQPNVLFAAADADKVYFPSAGLRVDRSGSIRSPILLDEGLVYSVESMVPSFDPGYLRSVPPRVPAWIAGLYLQLPDGLPARVEQLARRVTAGAGTVYDRAEAVQAWLRAHTVYDLDVPRDPEGVDAVDHFLFVTRRGFCEQIASSMAVMLRTLGIPTRLVTGFGPGIRNPLTGYLEVRQSDAHAWVEVYMGREAGWVPFDPTFGVPAVNLSGASRFMAGPVFAAIGRFLQHAVPEPVKRGVGLAAKAVTVVATSAFRAWPAAVAAMAVIALAAWLLRRRRGRRRPGDLPPGEAAFLDLVDALTPAGHARAAQITPSRYLDEVSSDLALDADVIAAAEVIVRTFEQERFARENPAPSTFEQARMAVQRVRVSAGHR